MGTVVDADDNKAFASDYMLLNPKEVGVKGLFQLLTTGNPMKKRRYIDTPKIANLVDGWRIFVSIFMQKVLLLLSKPMAWRGAINDFWLNLLYNNGGFLGLIFNIIRFKVVIPDKNSATWLSGTAHADGRVDIDSSIKHGEPRYYEALALLAAKIAYENEAYIKNVVENRWKMELLGVFDFWNNYLEKRTTQVFIMREKTADSEMIVVAFRGTESSNAHDWCCDVDISWYKIPGMGRIHAGFMKALGMQKNTGWPKEIEQDPNQLPVAYYYIRDILRKLVEANPQARFIVTGHSLGGALAILFPSLLAVHDESRLLDRLHSVYTFGQPRVGDGKFGEFVLEHFKKHGVRYYRVVYCNDIVPRIPFDISGRMFKHFGMCLYYNSFYKGEVVGEVPFKNYFSIFAVIPMTINAAWEMVRGFIYPYIKGPIYKENSSVFRQRLNGLIMPGVSAHMLQDYNNCTRLGSVMSDIQFKLDHKI